MSVGYRPSQRLRAHKIHLKCPPVPGRDCPQIFIVLKSPVERLTGILMCVWMRRIADTSIRSVNHFVPQK